jgi:hypothetical protein
VLRGRACIILMLVSILSTSARRAPTKRLAMMVPSVTLLSSMSVCTCGRRGEKGGS